MRSYTFGQPRVGDEAFVTFSSSKLTSYRVVHNQDVVPHVPVINYYHTCSEVFEDASGKILPCAPTTSSKGTDILTYCEDPSCANQFKYAHLTVEDHMSYLGLNIGCEAVSRSAD